MGLLDGGLQRVVSGVFRGFLLDGLLYRPTVRTDGGDRTASGKIIPIAWADPLPIKGIDAEVTLRMAQAPNATSRDAQLIVLQIDANGAVITPSLGESDEVFLRGRRWKLSMITTDPAQGAWIMRGTPTEITPAS